MTAIIEIQTIEGGRLEWVSIFSSTSDVDAVRWGDTLLEGFGSRWAGRVGNFKPNLRVTDSKGNVIGAWQAEGYEPAVGGSL